MQRVLIADHVVSSPAGGTKTAMGAYIFNSLKIGRYFPVDPRQDGPFAFDWSRAELFLRAKLHFIVVKRVSSHRLFARRGWPSKIGGVVCFLEIFRRTQL
jgi:hypothetical protein